MRALPPPDPSLTRQLLGHLTRWLEASPQFAVIAAFAALPDEPDLLPLCHAFPERAWLLPRIDGDRLTLHRLPAGNPTFVPGPLGLREPAPDWPAVDPATVDLFLCPGLAFDHHGHRLGRGRGYYDRLLASARPQAVTAGITRTDRIVPHVPVLAHDHRVAWLASEAGIHPCTAGPPPLLRPSSP